ncbi:MAG: hypothetical protein ACI3X1_06905 [Eubacteriales bacterium]
MKTRKILFALIIFSLLVSLMALPSAALFGEYRITVSEDYSYLTFDGEKYIRVESNSLLVNTVYTDDIRFEGGNDAAVVWCEAAANDTAVSLYVDYTDGGSGSYLYVKESMLESYTDFLANSGDSYTFEVSRGSLEIDKDDLYASQISIKGYELNYYSYVGPIYTTGLDNTLRMSCGYIMKNADNEYFYVNDASQNTDLTMQSTVKIWQITDEKVISGIHGILFDEPWSNDDDTDLEGGGLIFGVIIFALALGALPLVAGVVTFIMSLKKDKQSKTLLRIISALCAAAFVITLVTIIIIIAIAV